VTSEAVRSVRERIEAVASRENRVAILGDLGCLEPRERGAQRRRAGAGAAAGDELLAAIDRLDSACLKGDDEEVEAAGAHLAALWARYV
jgi:hypothetical protein